MHFMKEIMQYKNFQFFEETITADIWNSGLCPTNDDGSRLDSLKYGICEDQNGSLHTCIYRRSHKTIDIHVWPDAIEIK